MALLKRGRGIDHNNTRRQLSIVLAISLMVVIALSTFSSMNRTAKADGVINRLPIVGASSIAVDSRNGNLYVAISGSNASIVLISGTTNTVLATIPLPGSPQGIVFDPIHGNLYVTVDLRSTGYALIVLSASTNKVIATIPIAIPGSDVAFYPANGNVYLTVSNNSYQIYHTLVISASTNKVIATIPLPGSPQGIVFDPIHGNVYVTVSYPAFGVIEISGTTNKVIGTLIPAEPILHGILFDSVNGNLYVANAGSDHIITVINSTTNAAITPSIHMGGYSSIMLFNSVNEKIYVAGGNNTISAIDGSTRSVVATISLNSLPSDIAIDSSNGNLYVLSGDDNTVTIIDVATNKVVGTPIPVDNFVSEIALDPFNGYVYVAGYLGLSIISPAAPFPSPQLPLTNPQSVGFVTDEGSGIGTGRGKYISCSAGTSDMPMSNEPFTTTPFFAFGAANNFKSHTSSGYWYAVLGGGPGRGDFGSIRELKFNGTHFMAVGNWVGIDESLTPKSPTLSPVLLCGGPLSNSTTVTISGYCNSHQVYFAATNGMRAIFAGKVTCINAQQNLTVNSVDLAGNPLPGVFTVIRSSINGTILKSGFTPFTFTADTGAGYNVLAANYAGKVFKHWQDGSAIDPRSVRINTTSATITASYETGHSLRGFTSLIYNGTNAMPHLTVEAKLVGSSNSSNTSNSEMLHMWTTIDPQSTNSSSTTYKVYATNGYQNLAFDHWSDNGSTDRIRTITIGQATTMTAYYKAG